MNISATYHSEWDMGTLVSSNCALDPKTLSIVKCESVDTEGLETLQREYVELEVNGTFHQLEAEQAELTALGKEQFKSVISSNCKPGIK